MSRPSVLHPRDNLRLLETLTALREKGNSLVIVEHDEETMRRADHIVDLGPRAGSWRRSRGDRNVARHRAREKFRDRALFEDAALSSNSQIAPQSERRRELDRDSRGAREQFERMSMFAFRSDDSPSSPEFPAPGKSTLMHDVLWPAVRDELNEKKRTGNGDLFKLVSGAAEIEAVYEVDQSPIGKTSRSTPGTYIKVFDEIRIFTRNCRSRACADIPPAGFPSTPKAAVAKPAKARA